MRVGVLGLGVIGQPIAARLVSAGFEVAVFDVRDEPVVALKAAGAVACVSPAAVAARSEIIISLVSDAAQTDAVVSGDDGILGALRPGAIFVTGSTLGPAPVRAVAERLATEGCATLDAPISGGYLAAAEGTLSLMVGGAQDTLDQAMPALRAFATNITRVGEVGAGQVAKLAHQLVCSVNAITLLEGLSLGVAGGVDPEALKQVLREGVADSRVLRLWDALGPRWKGMLKAPAAGGAPSNLQKDLHLVLELARELGLELQVTPAASDAADRGVATGRDNPDL
jgi:3-hydroxyisobutyrate dehydrogenase-like beta-hydroxyacid dehydrogenase